VKKKQPLTLIETLIALILSVTLVLFLSTSLRILCKEHHDLERIKDRELAIQKLHLRLKQIFNNLSTWEDCDEQNPPLFGSASIPESRFPVFLFSYYSEADPEANYIGRHPGMLYLDKQQKLCLVTWPQRKEILLHDVDQLSFQFFDPEKKKWVKKWNLQKQGLPSMIHLKWQMNMRGKEKEQANSLLFFPHLASPWIQLKGD